MAFALFFVILLYTSIAFSQETIRFAVIGDYGSAGVPEREVSTLVKNWNPDFIITLGDNNYVSGSASTIDQNIGQYYHDFIYPYTGTYGSGATENRFFPSLGNHDWETSGAVPYLNYFTLPGNERYYDFVKRPIHFFAIDSDPREPDGTASTSAQAGWLKKALSNSDSRWNIVYFHHPPYSSGSDHGSDTTMQWPFQSWATSVVLTGHEHLYERLSVDGIPYIVNGLGGRSRYGFSTPLPQSEFRYNSDYGAMFVTATVESLSCEFRTRRDSLIDRFVLTNPWTSIDKDEHTSNINSFRLEQNYPNPFNPSTTISYAIPNTAYVTVTISNILGEEIQTLVHEQQTAGLYHVRWKAGNIPSGIYFCRLQTNSYIESKKLLLVK